MHIRFTATLGLLAAALTLSSLPAHAQAPAAPVAPATGTTQYPKQFQIAPSYVFASEASYKKAKRHLASGPNHDALLLAALLKNGAHLTPGPQIITTDGVSGDITSNSSRIQVQPRANADGSVTVQLLIQADAGGLGLPQSSSGSIKLQTQRTFQDKQTLLIGGTGTTDQHAKNGSELLVFVRVSTPDPH